MKTGLHRAFLAVIRSSCRHRMWRHACCARRCQLVQSKMFRLSRLRWQGRDRYRKEDGHPGPGLPGRTKMSDDELTTIIADGKDKMPSYKKGLKPEQIKDLVGYIRSLAKK